MPACGCHAAKRRWLPPLPQPDAHANKITGSLTLVSALLELLVVGCLLDEVQDGDGQVRPREGVRLGVHSVFRHCSN